MGPKTILWSRPVSHEMPAWPEFKRLDRIEGIPKTSFEEGSVKDLAHLLKWRVAVASPASDGSRNFSRIGQSRESDCGLEALQLQPTGLQQAATLKERRDSKQLIRSRRAPPFRWQCAASQREQHNRCAKHCIFSWGLLLKMAKKIAWFQAL